ncbi:MAG: hypothetical protein ACR2PZ_22035, partial [Pseudomonadales bacterium]
PYWTGYVHTDLEVAAETVPALGGQIFTMPTKSRMGTSFVFTDAGGAVLAAYDPSDSFTVPPSSRENEIVWQRLYSADNNASTIFYETLLGWHASEKADQTRAIHDSSGAKVGDMGAKPSWVDTDTWVYFIGVGDISTTASAIESGTGSIIETTQARGQSALVAKDSQGGVIGFVEC